MNKDRFSTYLKQPESMSEESLEGLRSVVNDYPYFTAGRIMLLRNLHASNDSDYEKELPLTAIYAGNREILYNYIFKQTQKAEVEIADTTEAIDVVRNIESVSEEKAERQHVIKTEAEIPLEVELPKETPIPEKESAPAPLFESNENSVYSFAQWLEIMSDKKPAVASAPSKPTKNWDLIDNFIQESPKIGAQKSEPTKSAPTFNMADQSSIHHEEFMTETLAKIYIKQKHYKKAIQIFKKLSLKYPEKSIYFAGQIKIVEQLLNNEK